MKTGSWDGVTKPVSRKGTRIEDAGHRRFILHLVKAERAPSTLQE